MSAPRLKRTAFGLVVASVISVAGMDVAKAIEPKTASEVAAVNARLLQTEMMVAALTCDLRPQYNRAVRAFERELVHHGQVLRTMFKRSYGGGAQRQLDKYITRLANDASARSNRNRVAFCRTAASLFENVLASRSGGFDQLTERLIQEAALPIQAR